jgi:pyruvate/2-oxoglutarate dehydrogenase complex dihydrolipoamide dehydrogenase (E3) component
VTRSYDLVVIGGGSGGLVAAREARRRRASVVIVQDGPVGGDCTFTGCIPSKTLLAAAAAGAGFDDAMQRVRRTVERIAATEDAAALATDGIDVINGFARFSSPTTIVVDGTTIRSKRFVVATGARPTLPPLTGLAESSPLTSDTLFELSSRPESMLVLGGGPIGCEMSQAFARLGTRVTLLEAADRVLPREEPEASQVIAAALTADGVDVRVGVRPERVGRIADGDVCLHTADGTSFRAAELLVAVGRTPSGRGFGLEELGVEIDHRGAVVIDHTTATRVSGIWAVGDVTGGMQFTHVAGRMGWVAASNALSRVAKVRGFRFDPTGVPWATFTTPEVGRVGLTEAEAAAAHPGARVAHLPLEHVDRAVTAGAEHGFVKLIAAPKRVVRHLGGGRLVGATIVAPTGGDLIHEAALAMQTNMFVGRLAQTSHAYPSWAMGVQQAALQFFGPSSGGLRARPVNRQGTGQRRGR